MLRTRIAGVHHLGLYIQLQSERGSLNIVYLPLCNVYSWKPDVRIIYLVYSCIMIAVSTAVPARRRTRCKYVHMQLKHAILKRQSGLEALCVPHFEGTIQATFLASNFPNLSRSSIQNRCIFFSLTFWYIFYFGGQRTG